jgi:hypothetical protein
MRRDNLKMLLVPLLEPVCKRLKHLKTIVFFHNATLLVATWRRGKCIRDASGG